MLAALHRLTFATRAPNLVRGAVTSAENKPLFWVKFEAPPSLLNSRDTESAQVVVQARV